MIFLLLTFALAKELLAADVVKEAAIEFGADYYERSLETNVVKGNGNAWIKSSDREVHADQIEIDFTIRRAVAIGHVRVVDSESDISCQRLSYTLDGTETILDDAAIVSGQMVLQGATIRRMGKRHYDIEEGSYTNCNDGQPPTAATSCVYDWKLYGKRFSIDVGQYAHVSDVLILIKDIPIFYSPYLIIPIKSERQTGFLLPSLTSHDKKGSGFTLPFFWAMAPWQDLTVTPTFFSKTGHHVGLAYRYSYSREIDGFINYYFMKRHFGASRNPEDDLAGLGPIGEWGIYARHRASFSNRSFLNVETRLVSHPFYAIDYGSDVHTDADLASIRSQATYSKAADNSLWGVGTIYHQSLITPKDSGVDGGGATKLPLLLWSQSNSPLDGQLFSYQVDTEFANFYRGGSGVDANNAIRTGQRMLIEPKLVTSIPMPRGFQFQPIWSWGFLGYHFAIPTDSAFARSYSSLELPLSAYLSRVYGDSDSPKLSHVIQPRIVYSKNLFQSELPNHPFFTRPLTGLSKSPFFDLKDLLLPYEFLRLELLSRFRRQTGTNTSSRVFLIQLSEQFNIRNSQNDDSLKEDPRFAKALGPIDLRTELLLGNWSGQLQASYQLETTQSNGKTVRENDWSGGIEYRPSSQDMLALSTRLLNRADDAATEQTVRFNFIKTTQTFANFEGEMEYSIHRKSFVRYALGTLISKKPASCWAIMLRAGEENMETPSQRSFYYRIFFKLDFGTPTRMMRDT